MVVVPGTWHEVEASPVGPFEFFQSFFNGMVNAGEIVFIIPIFIPIFAAIFIGLGYDAVVGLAGVKLEKWWKFIFPVFFALVGVRAVLMVIAVAMGFGA
ncbi:MAG: hypothetical protein SPK68_00120 [Lachnospiraceae bacterium]|nr:hypothetical protein [Lachnospiraceae bacterium]